MTELDKCRVSVSELASNSEIANGVMGKLPRTIPASYWFYNKAILNIDGLFGPTLR